MTSTRRAGSTTRGRAGGGGGNGGLQGGSDCADGDLHGRAGHGSVLLHVHGGGEQNDGITAAITTTTASVCTVQRQRVTVVSGTGTCRDGEIGSGRRLPGRDPDANHNRAGVDSTVSWTQSTTLRDATGGVLNATANVAGKFAYTANGNAVTATTVLSAGSYTMGVTFTPTASKDYPTATASVSLTVNPINTTTTITGTAPKTNPLKVTVSFTVSNGVTPVTGSTLVTVTAGTGQTCTGTVSIGTCALTFVGLETTTLTASYRGTTTTPGARRPRPR